MVIRKDTLNGSAGLLLLGSLFFNSGNVLKAKEIPEKDLKQHAIEYYNLLEEEVNYELKKRREDFSHTEELYHFDLILEQKLMGNYDMTIESQEIAKNFMKDVYLTSAKKALDRFELYVNSKKDLRENLKNLRDSIIKEDIKLESILRSSERKGSNSESNHRYSRNLENEKNIANLLGFNVTDIGFDTPSLDREGIEIKAHAKFISEDGTLTGKINISNREARAVLQSIISDKIYMMFNADLKYLNEPERNVGISLGEKNENGKWDVTVGYQDGPNGSGVYASAGIVKKF